MLNLRFEAWCRKAVARIALPKDRIVAGRELKDHMEDRYQGFLDSGMDPKEAEQRTIEAMGSAEEVARQLGAAYQPFWHLIQQRTKRVLIVMLCVAAFFLACFIMTNAAVFLGYAKPVYERYDPYNDTAVSDGIGKIQRVFYTEPNVKDSSDGYSMTLTQAALWHADYVDSLGVAQEDDYFYFRIEVFNIRPWAAYDDVYRWFWAEDSLGNRYYAAYERGGNAEPTLQGKEYKTGPLSRLWDMYLTDYISQDAQWIDLHYDRAGRDVVLRIDLTGGDGA